MKLDFSLPPPPEAAPSDPKETQDLTLGLGEVLRKIREARDLTRGEVAKTASVSASTIQALETGRQRLTVDTLQTLADALEMELAVSLVPKAANEQQRAAT